MKKIITAILVASTIACIIAPEQRAQAQVITNRCCDANNVIRCIISPPTTLGGACFCYGQGYGYGC